MSLAIHPFPHASLWHRRTYTFIHTFVLNVGDIATNTADDRVCSLTFLINHNAYESHATST
jgi:hypothetical protein